SAQKGRLQTGKDKGFRDIDLLPYAHKQLDELNLTIIESGVGNPDLLDEFFVGRHHASNVGLTENITHRGGRWVDTEKAALDRVLQPHSDVLRHVVIEQIVLDLAGIPTRSTYKVRDTAIEHFPLQIRVSGNVHICPQAQLVRRTTLWTVDRFPSWETHRIISE